jgi:hypothetical protein
MDQSEFPLNKKPVNYLIHGQPLNYSFYFPYALFVIVYYKQLYKSSKNWIYDSSKNWLINWFNNWIYGFRNQWYDFFKNFRILSNRSEYNGFTNAYNKNMYFICIGLQLGIVKKKFEINKLDLNPLAIHLNKPIFILKNEASKLNFTMPKIKTLPKEAPKLNVVINLVRPELDINKETIFADYETYKTENYETINNKIYGIK